MRMNVMTLSSGLRNFVFVLIAVEFIQLAGNVKSFAADYRTNCCEVKGAPNWLSSYTLQDLAVAIESKMHWSTRRIKVEFYGSGDDFQRASGLNFVANAFFNPNQQLIGVSPQKDLETFKPTFRHEMVHVISNQKFKGAIPNWLEEGFANYLGSKRQVDYKWLASQNIPDASQLRHPSTDEGGSKMHYQLSTATVEMIAKKCNLNDLLMLATGSKLTNYLETFCKIKNVGQEVRDWVALKSK